MSIKVMVGINTLTQVDQYVYGNHSQFWFRMGRHFHGFNGTQEINFTLNAPRRMSIDRMRNQTAKLALEHGHDYVLFIDDDVLIQPNDFDKLLAADKDIIAGTTYIRGYPYHPMYFKFREDSDNHFVDNYKELADEDGLIALDAVGFSFCLIKTSLLRKLQVPFFVTGERHTEDVYFCKIAKIQVPDVTIFGHAKVQTAHILGPAVIDDNRLEMQRCNDEFLNSGIKEEQSGRIDRHLEYYERIGVYEQPVKDLAEEQVNVPSEA